jgi:hypothetical protein
MKKGVNFLDYAHNSFDIERLRNFETAPKKNSNFEQRPTTLQSGPKSYDLEAEKKEKAALEQRQKLRKEIILLFGENEYSLAMTRIKELISISRSLFVTAQRKYFYSYIVDNLLFVKCFVKQDKVQFANEILLQCWKIIQTFLNDSNYKVKISQDEINDTNPELSK